MATVKDALNIARTLLNDDVALIWGDAVLMPKLRLAHVEMESKLILNGISVIIEETAAISVPALALNLSTNQPIDIVNPIKMVEYASGEDSSQAINMARKEFIPNWPQTDTLRVWAWRENLIIFVGATSIRNVILYYEKRLTAPILVSENLAVITSEAYLGPRVAALAEKDQNVAKIWNDIAQDNLSKLVRTQVKGQQSLPSRKLPFSWRSRRGRTRFF